MDTIKFCSESHKLDNFCKTPDRNVEIRFYSEVGDVDIIVDLFKKFINDLPFEIRFTSAQLRQKLPDIPNNRKDEKFYPLRLHAGNITVMLSEVRTGYHGHSTYAMLECLKLAGFKLDKRINDRIYNESKIDMTILKELAN